jgi:hypothetical protein
MPEPVASPVNKTRETKLMKATFDGKLSRQPLVVLQVDKSVVKA